MSLFSRKRKRIQSGRNADGDKHSDWTPESEKRRNTIEESPSIRRLTPEEFQGNRGTAVHDVQSGAGSGNNPRHTFDQNILDSLIAKICLVDDKGIIRAVNRTWDRFVKEIGVAPTPDSSKEIDKQYVDIYDAIFSSDATLTAKLAEGLRSVLEGRLKRFTIEASCRPPNGHRRYLLTISPIGSDRGGAVISHVNISEQARLRQSNMDLDAFAQSVALNFRKPLGRLTEDIEALADVIETFDPELQTQVDDIILNVHRLDTMVSDLLAYSRVRRLPVDTRPVDLKGVIDLALSRVSDTVAQTNAEIEKDGTFPHVMANEELLLGTLVALLSNALKFVESGERPQIVIRSETDRDAVCLWIEDRGIGLVPQDVTRIFGMFERSWNAATYPGNGIGLALVKRSMERMGGQVKAVRHKDKGSAFKLVFPKRTRRSALR